MPPSVPRKPRPRDIPLCSCCQPAIHHELNAHVIRRPPPIDDPEAYEETVPGFLMPDLRDSSD